MCLPLCAGAKSGGSADISPKLQHNLRTLAVSVNDMAGAGFDETTQAYTDSINSFAAQFRLTAIFNKLFVEFFIHDTGAATDAFLARYGIARDNYYSRIKGRVQALVPAAQLNALAGDTAVDWVQPPDRPHTDVISEGVAQTYADTYHNHVPPYAGAGVGVAIVDEGFQGYQSLLGTDLPATVIAKSFRSDGDITGDSVVHGTACAEIVHDMAPSAQLYLINFQTVNDLTNAINYCESQNISIISHSVGWYNEDFYDGTGAVGQIVNSAVDAGILWCSASGNDAQGHWDGVFSDPDSDSWENFNGSDETIKLSLTAGNLLQLNMTWDQWPHAATDYDLYLYKDDNSSPGEQVALSNNVQTGKQPPTEEIDYTPQTSGVYDVKILWNAGPVAKIALFTYEINFNDYDVPERSMSDPAAAASAFAVGAVGTSTKTVEPYSGEGPTEDGRLKPDISAPDCTASDVYGTFCGTSAATPHTAGAAALLLSQNPKLSVDSLKVILKRNAATILAPSPNDLYGAGFLRMPDITPPTAPVVSSRLDSLDKTASSSLSVFFGWTATDTWSGVAGYSYVIDNKPETTPPNVVNSTATGVTSQALDTTMKWYIHVSAVDSAGNWSAATNFGPVSFAEQPLNPIASFSLHPVEHGIRVDWVNPSQHVDGTAAYDLHGAYFYADSSSVPVDSVTNLTAADAGLMSSHVIQLDTTKIWSLSVTAVSEQNANSGKYTLSEPSGYLSSYAGAPLQNFQINFDAPILLWTNGTWEESNQASVSAPNSLVSNSAQKYARKDTTFCQLPPFIRGASDSTLEFQHILLAANLTTANLELTTNNGVTWTLVRQYGQYNYVAQWHGDSLPIAQCAWHQEAIDLRPFSQVGDTLSLRFILNAGFLTSYGWFIDNLNLDNATPNYTPEPGAPVAEFVLSQNYPNPFGNITSISFSLPVSGMVHLGVYNALGEQVQTLADGAMTAGNYSVNFNGAGLPPGVYFYTLRAGQYALTKKMAVIQ